MKELDINLTVAALSVGLAFCITALAEGLSNDNYKAGADYAVAREQCDDQAGNAKDVCVTEAKAAAGAAKAEATAAMK